MRIIGGSRRGRRLVDWEEHGIRPMRDFVRGALFSIISDFVPGAAFLDLYCGPGSVGLEALSRGSRCCTFVDHSREACGIVRRNLDVLELLDVAEVIEKPGIKAIELFKRRGRRFDVIFFDPPYYGELVPLTLRALADGRILSDDPVVVAALHRTEAAPEC
jgi:16S rRNA (guanine966-N2)-methyltransferase